MGPLSRKSLAVFLSGSLLLAAPGGGAFAQRAQLADELAPEEDPKEAIAYLQNRGVFKGPDDPLRTYIGNERKLTPLGEALYKYLRAQANPAEELDGFKDAFESLRKAGPFSKQKEQVIDAVFERYQAKFGALPGPTGGEAGDTFRYGTLVEAYMTGAAVTDPPKKAMTQVEAADGEGWEFYDDQGLAFRLNKNQITTYNRELQKQQRELNRTRPPQAPFIPETGRYNVQMLQLSHVRLKQQAEELLRAYRMDRMINMAELLGKQYKEDMWFKDLSLEADLEKWARAKTYTHGGRTYSVYDIVDAKTKNRKAYLDKAMAGISQFEAEIEKLKGADTITDSKLASMQMSEQYVLRYLSLIFLESQKFYVKNQLERLDPRSPDSQLIQEAIKEAPGSEETRRKFRAQGEQLRKRLQRLQTIFGTVQDALSRSDYASSLDLVQAGLNRCQKELQEISLDYTLYVEAPSSGVLAKSQVGRPTPSFNGTMNPSKWDWGFVRWAVEKTGVVPGHKGRMQEVRQSLPHYDRLYNLVADGKYWEARKAVIAMSPDAAVRRMDLGMGGGVKVTDNLRVTSALRDARDVLARVQKVNKWADTVGNFLTWTTTMALGGPLISGSLSGVARGVRRLTLPSGHKWEALTKYTTGLVAETLEHTAIRIRSLNPAEENLKASSLIGRYLESSVYRGASFAGRQASFTMLSGVISGGFTVATHLVDNAPFKVDLGVVKFGEGHSLYNSWTDAAGEGFVGGVQWANESFHPALGYVGLPYSAFEGGRLSFITQTLGDRGVFGTVGALTNRALGRFGWSLPESMSLNALASRGTAGAWTSFGLGIVDNVAKYHLFTVGLGKAAEQISWARNYDEKDVERRIKRSQKAGLEIMESPAWMLIPAFPAKYEEAAAGYQRSLQGAKEYLNSPDPSLRAKLANAPEESYLPLLSRPKTPAMQMIFQLTVKGGRQADKEFLVTKDIKRQAISEELLVSVPGGGKGAKLSQINPLEFLRISQLDPKTTPQVGNLHVTDDVKFVAREKFADALRANQTLAERILNAKPGSSVSGFGVVTPAIRREVAVQMHLDKAAGRNIAPGVAAKAAEILDRYLKADNLGGPAKSLLEAIRARNDSGAAAEKFDSIVKKQLELVGEWKRKIDAAETQEHYMGVLGRLKENADDLLRKGELTAKQHETLKRWYEYVEAGEARFQAFNNVEMTHTLVAEELSAMKEQYGGSKGMRSVLDEMGASIERWKGQYPDLKAKVEAPGELRFKDLMSELDALADKAASSRSISPAESQALRASLREMRASPWILHDSKGTALSGWRPGQFESLMESLGLAVIQGQNGQAIREFIRLTTGGGKTLLTFEGLLPLAEADAAHRGMKVSFLTVQSNLEAQARLEFMSLKKIGSKLEFDTYEGFKSQIAEAKSKGEKFIEKHWILGDEMDGAALQPALTLGETTGRLTRLNSVYHRINEINDFMTGLLGKRANELGEQVKVQVRHGQAVIDGLPPGSPEAAAARRATEKMLRSAEALTQARTPEARLKAQEQLAQGLMELRGAAFGEPLPAKVLEGLYAGGQALTKAAEELRGRLTPKKRGGLEALVKDELKALEGAGGPQASALRRNAQSLLETIREAKTAEELSTAVRQKVDAQRGLLSAETSLAGERRASLETAMTNITHLLDQARRMEGARERRLRLEGELKQVNAELKTDKANEGLKARRELIESELEAAREVEADFAAGLVHQQNLLRLVKGGENARLDAVRLEARKILDAADQRVQRIKKDLSKTTSAQRRSALEGELALAEKEIALARRFEDVGLARGQKLLEKVAQLKETGAGAEKLAQAEGELARVRDGLTPRDQALLEAYSQELGKLKDAVKREAFDEIAGSRSRLNQLRRDALETRADARQLAEARRHFAESGEEILSLVRKGDSSAEGEAAVLLKRRSELLEAFAGEENPAYAVFRKMKEDAYSFARNLVLEDGAAIAARSRENAARLIDDHLGALKGELKQLETAPAGELKTRTEGLLKEQIAAWEKLPRQGDVLGPALDLSIKQAGERNGLVKTLNKQRAGLDAGYVSALETSLTSLASRDKTLGQRLQDEAKTLKTASEENVIAQMEKRIDGSMLGLLGVPKLVWQTFTGRPLTVKTDEVGLTRIYAAKLLREIVRDPVMPGTVRDQMFWELVPSLLQPKRSYVREEFLNMVRGYYDNPATIRVDNITGKINVIHNGQWFETMDNPTRRFWEVHYGTDLTLKYTHKSLSTIKDLTANKNARFISLSATAGEKYKAHLLESKVEVGGKGATAPKTVELAVHHGETSKTMSVSQALRRVMEESKKRVAFRPAEILEANSGAPKTVRDYLKATGLAKKDAMVLELDAIPAGEVRKYFSELRALQGENTGLVVLSLSDTVMLKKIRNYLIKTGAVKEHEIAQVFSDAEWLRINRPEARVHEQMNLDGMPTGKVRILLLDTRVGGRGLDLDYKGLRSSTKPESFKGYTNYEMLVIDPHEMSAVHLLQAQGRIDLGRVLPGAQRRFELVLDVQQVQKDAHFKAMMNDNPFFVGLRNDPAILDFARREGVRLNKKVEVDWLLIDSYVKNLERRRVADLSLDPAVQAFAREKGRPIDARLIRDYLAQADDAVKAKHGLVERYELEVRRELDRKQQNVEEDQLRSSSVLQDRPIIDHRLRWLDMLAR